MSRKIIAGVFPLSLLSNNLSNMSKVWYVVEWFFVNPYWCFVNLDYIVQSSLITAHLHYIQCTLKQLVEWIGFTTASLQQSVNWPVDKVRFTIWVRPGIIIGKIVECQLPGTSFSMENYCS